MQLNTPILPNGHMKKYFPEIQTNSNLANTLNNCAKSKVDSESVMFSCDNSNTDRFKSFKFIKALSLYLFQADTILLVSCMTLKRSLCVL